MSTIDESIAFPTLSPSQIEQLQRYGEVQSTQIGDILFQVGDKDYDWFVIITGALEILSNADTNPELLAVRTAGQFLGEISLLTGQTAFLTARVQQAGSVLKISSEKLREIIATNPELSELVLNAFLMRREILQDNAATSALKIVGSRFSSDTQRLRAFAARNQLPHQWIDVERDTQAESLLTAFQVAPQDTPIVIWQGKEVLRNPSDSDLTRRLGLNRVITSGETVDLIVIGAGPGGLAASVYGASEGLSTLTLEAVSTGGQAGTSSKIENYLGFPAGLSGAELANRAVVQAQKFGARIVVSRAATQLWEEAGHYIIQLADGEEVTSRNVIIATGARYRKLPVANLAKYEGQGIYYAATQTEAQLCYNEPVMVVGGGNSAGKAAIFLDGHAKQVYIDIRRESLASSMSRYLIDRIERTENITVLSHTEVVGLVGERSLEQVVIQNNQTQEKQELPIKEQITFIGADPHTQWLQDVIALDDRGFILTGNALKQANNWKIAARDPFLLETSMPGVFAVGDVRSGSVKRVASAVGEGSIAVKFIFEYQAIQ
ncbi:MAG: FAD-dependent oxidoreductase [Cyclobacteriaceae bacterium]